MPVVILVLALLAYAYALVTEPGFRRWGLLGGAAAGLGLAIYFWQSAPENAASATRIPAAEITLDELVVETTARGAELSGRVHNASPEFRLREFTLALRLHDCPDAQTGIGDCPVIGDATAIARPDTPPGQVRGFTAQFVFSNLPVVTGELRWEHEIVETRATD